MNGLTSTIMLRASLITIGGLISTLIATTMLRASLLNNRMLFDPNAQDGQNENTTEDTIKDIEK